VADPAPVTVIGIADDRLDLLWPEACHALASADAVAGGRRHLRLWQSWDGRPVPGPGTPVPETLEIGADTDEVGRAVARWADASRRVCVLASGDPGFFGIVRSLLRVVERRALRVLPAPSSVSIAFGRLGLPWDDATVVSAHGRPLADAVNAVRTARKAAVLTSPGSPPEALGAALVDAGTAMDLVAVCSRLGSPDEVVTELSLGELAAGSFDPLSVVVLVGPGGLPLVGWEPGPGKVLAWGTPEAAYGHRAGMITKSEIRSVVLGKLALPATGVLWDVGAGSGSVAVECALVQPGLTVMAVEHRSETAARISANAAAQGASVHVVAGRAPAVLGDLPPPDRAFVGGGGLDALDAVTERLRPGGRVVATYAAIDRAAAAADRLGHLVEVGVSRAERLPDGGWRLAAQNPVFVAWGPE
jgi:precorrin-6B C5,15-methyltransferase / cobalt-precorrin-6B C5,C15-methyltransferase